jgi:hypothetical protein
MNRFVDECRREWRRLGVADAVADEMAEELAADLAEAEAEGASPEDVLGDGIVDPRSFAAAWAASRGVVRSRPGMAGPRRKPSMLAAGTGLVLVVLLAGVGLVLFGPGSLVLRSHYGVGAAFGGGSCTAPSRLGSNRRGHVWDPGRLDSVVVGRQRGVDAPVRTETDELRRSRLARVLARHRDVRHSDLTGNA